MTDKPPLKFRIALWYARHKIVKAIKKGQKMKSLPKWMAWVSNLGAAGALCTTLAGILPPKYAAVAATLATFLNSITHSLPGTGGKPPSDL